MFRQKPETKPLFDEAFRRLQRKRHGSEATAPPRLFTEAQARLQERLEDVTRPFLHAAVWEKARLDGEEKPDLVTSCLALQDQNDLPGALAGIHALLAPGGLFMGVMAGGESLRELRSVLMEAELALTGRVSPRVAPMLTMETAGRLLLEAGFALPVADVERLLLVYPDLNGLMRDLRLHGRASSLSERPRAFTRRSLFGKAAEIYAKRFPGPTGAGIAVTLDLLFLHGWRS